MNARATIRQTYLVEHYWPGLTVEALQQCATRIRLAADEVGGEGKPVRYIRSTIVPADESLLCLLEAATEELVHETYARAGIPFDRISPAIPEAGEGGEQPPGAGGCVTEINQQRRHRPCRGSHAPYGGPRLLAPDVLSGRTAVYQKGGTMPQRPRRAVLACSIVAALLLTLIGALPAGAAPPDRLIVFD